MEDLHLFAKNSTGKAALILLVAIFASYSPVLVLGQTYNFMAPVSEDFLPNEKSTLFGTTGNKIGIYQAIWPNIVLARDSVLNGEFPLWNPHVALGKPLAIDFELHLLSPIMLPFLLPVEFWDVALLFGVWLAGFFTFLFLRSLRLGFASSISGGIIYMLSGAFVTNLPDPGVAVIIFTPLILFSIEKIIQNKNPKFIVLGAVSLACGILGGYPEPVILQIVLAVAYFSYRILPSIVFSNIKNNSILSPHTVLIAQNIKRILIWTTLSVIGALGLIAFYIFPMLEYINNLILGHSSNFASIAVSSINVLPIFIPYLLGQLHANWLGAEPSLIGSYTFVGTISLFFLVIAVWRIFKEKNDAVHRYTPLFFLLFAVFFIMKYVGFPLVSWIGYVPLFDLFYYTKNMYVIVPICLTIAVSFGIDYLRKVDFSSKILVASFLITLLIIFILFVPLIPHITEESIPSYVTIDDAKNYIGFQILQSVLFAFFIFLLCVAIKKNKSAIFGIIPLVILELSLYIPVGLHPLWVGYKAIILLIGMALITIIFLRPTKFTWNLEQKKVKLSVIIVVFLSVYSGSVLVSESSPFGMLNRYDPYQDNPVTDFLKENLGDSRMFSFDYALGPSYPAGYEISTMGILGAMTIDSFETYYFNFLDADALTDTLAFFSYDYGPNLAKEKFLMNKKYFDFLGLKYIVTEGYDFNTITFGTPGLFVQHDRTENLGGLVTVTDNKNSVGQSFISPVNSINSIGISFMASNHLPGTVYLDIDSIPYDKKFHRESSISKINEREFASFVFDHPIKDVENVELHMVLYYTPKSSLDHVSVVTFSTANPDFDRLKELNGKFYQNDQVVKNTQMVFSIESEQSQRDVVLPVVFKHENIRISENSDAFPRAFLVNEYHIQLPNYKKPFIKDMENCLHIPTCLGTAQMYILENPKFDLSSEIVIEESLPIEQAKELENSKIDENSSVEIISYESERVIIKSKNSTSAFLVLTDSFYPGWDAYIDGDETKIYRADGVVRAVYVPAGEHTIEFSYMPNSLLIGLFISLISAICLGFVLIKKF